MKTELKKALFQKMAYAAVAVAMILSMKQAQSAVKVGLAVFASKKFGNPQLTSGSAYINWMGADVGSFESTMFYLLLPFLAALPFGWSLAEEIRSGYAAHVIFRSGKKSYYTAKMTAAFCSGFLVIAVPLMLNFLVVSAFLPCLTPEILYPYGGLMQKSMLYQLYYTYPHIYVCAYILLDGIYGGLFAVIATASACFLANRFMTVLVPFGMCIALEYFDSNIAAYTGLGYDIAPERFLRAMPAANDHNGFIIMAEGIIFFLLPFSALVVRKCGRYDML